MSDTTVLCRNSFGVRRSLLIAVEAVYSDLTAIQVERIRSFAGELEDTLTPIEVFVTADVKIDISLCMKHFKDTETWRWLKEDFKDPILEFERRLLRF